MTVSKVDQYKANAADLVRDPDNPEALVNQFGVIAEKQAENKYHFCLAKRAYELAPQNISAMFNYASALHRIGEFEKAKDQFIKCIKYSDDVRMPETLHHVGIAYRTLGQNELAVEYYDKSLALRDSPFVKKDRALALMASGKLYEGLKAFEVRKEASIIKWNEDNGHRLVQARLPEGLTYWTGQDLKGKSIAIYHEEGNGDLIQFCRFFPKLRDLGVREIVLTGAHTSILELIAANMRIDRIEPLAGPYNTDYVVGSMSVPWLLGIDAKDISGKPYFKAEANDKIPLRGNLNVGIVWRGNPKYGMDVHRSMAFTEFCGLFDLPGVAFYSLQQGGPELEVTDHGFDGFIANLQPFCKTWGDTARAIQRLDAVVCVDTAVAHLAGALGKPAIVLLTNACDWRWNRHSRKQVWYDSVTTVRQRKQDEWDHCFKIVRDELKGMLRERRQVA